MRPNHSPKPIIDYNVDGISLSEKRKLEMCVILAFNVILYLPQNLIKLKIFKLKSIIQNLRDGKCSFDESILEIRKCVTKIEMKAAEHSTLNNSHSNMKWLLSQVEMVN